MTASIAKALLGATVLLAGGVPANAADEGVTSQKVIEYRLNRGEGSVTVNGSADISDEDRERLRLAGPTLYRDYFEYLYGMPMKLRDPDTNPEAGVKAAEFNGRKSWALRVKGPSMVLQCG